MLKVKLLNDGGYGGMGNVKFPITVNAVSWGSGVDVSSNQLNKHGATLSTHGYLYFSLLEGEYEVIKDDC